MDRISLVGIIYMVKRFFKFGLKIMPMRWGQLIVGVYGMVKLPTFSYSQKGEDILIDCFFNRRKNGYYLDIGCFHPRWISNTYLLHKRGWIGTGVDLEEHKLSFYKKIRGKKVNVIQAAVVGEKGSDEPLCFYKFDSAFGWSDVDTLDKTKADEWAKKHSKTYSVRNVKSLNINDLLINLPQVDFLNIDIEGLDLEVVGAIDFDQFKIRAILFEDTFNTREYEKLLPKLTSYGYRRLSNAGNSICFVLED